MTNDEGQMTKEVRMTKPEKRQVAREAASSFGLTDSFVLRPSSLVIRKGPATGRSQLPFVFLNAAITADGKIAPASRQFEPFGSERDQQLLLELRARADAVMCGAGTVNASPIKLGPGPVKYRRLRLRHGLAEYNLRIIVSGSGSVDPGAEIFKHRFSPIIVLTTERARKKHLSELRARADEVRVCGEREIDFVAALRWLSQKWQVKRLLCEGGGELNAALLRANQVDEIYVTICPVIFGGRAAPTLADGQGVESLADATLLDLKSWRRVGDELYLVYRVRNRRR
jgi:riboflavin-specific deaminase-like protein